MQQTTHRQIDMKIKNKFFFQTHDVLAEKRLDVIEYLRIKGVDNEKYLKAYDYFVVNNAQFDGATIVKDLNDLPHLPLAAMLHDYEYLTTLKSVHWTSWIQTKVRLDWEYGQNLESLGKGTWIPYTRAISLIISTPLYPVFIIYKKITS